VWVFPLDWITTLTHHVMVFPDYGHPEPNQAEVGTSALCNDINCSLGSGASHWRSQPQSTQGECTSAGTRVGGRVMCNPQSKKCKTSSVCSPTAPCSTSSADGTPGQKRPRMANVGGPCGLLLAWGLIEHRILDYALGPQYLGPEMVKKRMKTGKVETGHSEHIQG